MRLGRYNRTLVFEIGTSLREARLRQGLELSRAELDTKIRGKYLHALEDERFEAIPGETYVKGFLRAYAEYLGLDGGLYVDEFNSRFASAEDAVPQDLPSRRPRPRPRDGNLVVVALAGIVAVTVLVIVAWKFGSPGGSSNQPLGLGPGTSTVQKTPTTTAGQPNRPKRPAKARLVVTAARGDCWLRVRAGSATGPLVYEGTVQQGQTQRFVKWKRLWLQLGAPSNLNVKLNGHKVRNFPQTQSIVLVTPRGVRSA
ncbi:MAG: helix-turn-helix domain-containing protein [Actinobacteria bacterium]|nr:MAG: helix-turn-helix domain-containing protein [Actinomycetota bacterium]